MKFIRILSRIWLVFVAIAGGAILLGGACMAIYYEPRAVGYTLLTFVLPIGLTAAALCVLQPSKDT